ncbi:hypothetical protein MHYP_G00021200 [Metynnis hypsauchen]
MMTSWSWWMLATLHSSSFCLRMPHRCSLGFRSRDIRCQSITFTFSKAVVILEVCLGSLSSWKTAMQHSFRREALMLCFRMSQYMLEFTFPSMNHSSPVPAAPMQLQTMMLPPPSLTVSKIYLGTPHQGTATHAGHHLSQTSLFWFRQTTGHGSSNPCSWMACLQQTVCGLSCASASEEASF